MLRELWRNFFLAEDGAQSAMPLLVVAGAVGALAIVGIFWLGS